MPKTTPSSATPPERPGLYYISLSDAPLRQATYAYSMNGTDIKSLRSILRRILTVSTNRSYCGVLREEGKSIPPGGAPKLVANDQPIDVDYVSQIDDHAVYFLAKTVSHWINMLPPVYIGIAIDQTISQRLAQHQAGFSRPESGYSTFATRAKEQGLVWQDLRTSWIEAESGEHLSRLRSLERFLHATMRPIFSSR